MTQFWRTHFLPLLILSTSGIQLVAGDYKIAFGSCYDQHRPSEEIWYVVARKEPDLVVLTGDNVYIDSEDEEQFKRVYEHLAQNKGFQALKKQADVMGIWDDHDYGLNDGGKEFVAKELAKRYFLTFFDYPELRVIPEGQGIFHSRTIQVGGKRIRLIMLDTRWYRDKLLRNNFPAEERGSFQIGPYRPYLDRSKTLLGDEQWRWLESVLAKPVDLNIILSSIQFVSEMTGWEAWSNFPHERLRLIEMLKEYSFKKALLISGDAHRGEISVLPLESWDLIDVTASSLTSTTYPGKPNIYRVGPAYNVNNFCVVSIDVSEGELTVIAKLFDNHGVELVSHPIPVD